ncbi:phosphonate ABC transporter, periplasmic phosphonate-binding protein [Denitrovibrio acetiphilus DSM 12809]|jgi:phosphonate transport system substrate-binding protein|uniref:Phosphonate ABC transporter, periplasmic phosphonate-binding protein n=1 Tax=Denitrovibrio acetiphilus (strain DSM 12809 / NBRC 114555 / N2460) TaxID=522772 RepID=D4H4X4_DENA2|nr:PhnD/SsuA/transferrin family substrate-binding protein [Denitrovibrio acetiphilus]ADD69330.1 phosphonate ABC transporter, periplasmic phosphonate-binding protein [Denitrovibrio acetiphilus DSM 12809]
MYAILYTQAKFLIRKLRNFALAFILLSLLSCYNQETVVNVNEVILPPKKNISSNTLYIGFDLRWKPVDDVKFYIPLVNYLSQETGYDIKIKVPSDYYKNIQMLGDGDLDISIMGSVSCLIAQKRYGASPLLVGLNEDKQPFYKSAIIVKKGQSEINQISDVKGKVFAFGNRFSTQGYLIPRHMLENINVQMSDIIYEFSSSHDEAAKKVINGIVSAGAIQDKLAIKLANQRMVDILSFSQPYPSSTICISPLSDADKMNKIKSALLRLIPLENVPFVEAGWNMTEMAGGYVDAADIDFSSISTLIRKYSLAK